jgi:hypothetical protein
VARLDLDEGRVAKALPPSIHGYLQTWILRGLPSLDHIIRRCLEKTPDVRFQSANDLAFALETLAARVRHAPTAWLPRAVAAIAILTAAVRGFGGGPQIFIANCT